VPAFGEAFVFAVSSFIDIPASQKCGIRLPVLFTISMMRQLLDIVNQTVEIPLRVHFALGSQGEAVQPFVVPQVAEDRFDDPDAPPIELASALAVDRAPHALGVGQPRLMFLEERHLADRCLLRIAQTTLS
jgi:hypothetical protein